LSSSEYTPRHISTWRKSFEQSIFNNQETTMWKRRLIITAVTLMAFIGRGGVDLPTFKTVVARLIEKYFSHGCYYKIDDKLVF